MTYKVVINDFLLIDDIEKQFETKALETVKIFNYYAGEAVKYMMSVQGSGGAFWTNRTSKAVRSFFAETYARKTELVLGFAYDGSATNSKEEDYTYYLETMQDKRFAALPSILDKFSDMLIADIKLLYGDN